MCKTYLPKTHVLAFLLLSVSVATAEAAFNRELLYTGNLEAHSEEEDEAVSELELSLEGDQSWSRYLNDYDLNLSYFYDHRNHVDNDQYEGFYNGLILITESSSIVWNINANLEVLSEATGEDVDDFESQNLTIFSTGPTFRLFRNMRGVTELTALKSQVSYSEANLDSSQDEVNLSHAYPVSVNQFLTFALYHVSTEFDDSINAANDYDANRFSVAYESSNQVQDLRLWGAITDIDNQSDPDTQNEIEFQYIYRINARSTIGLDLADSLQNSAEFNARNINDRNVLLVSSLIRNKRIELGYGYRYYQNFYEARVFSEELDLLFEDDEPQEIIGGTLRFTRADGPEWRYFLEIEVTENDFVDERYESLTAAVTYRRQHTPYTSSEFELSLEADESSTEDRVDDYIFAYRLESALFR